MSKTFCPVPWNSIDTRNNGDLRLCCQSDVPLTKEDGTVYSISVDGLKTFRNSSVMKRVRKALLNGENPVECTRCQEEELAGVNSRRMYDGETWAKTCNAETVVPFTQEDGTIDIDKILLGHADLRFGNLCNLKCRMCGPTDSSAWYDEFFTVYKQDSFYASDKQYKIIKIGDAKAKLEIDSYNWQNDPKVWIDLEEQIPNLKHIFIIGGEPLLINEHFTFLEKCIEQGYASQMTIEIMTNLTSVPSKAWALWEQFKRVMICVSIDAVGELNDYIRYPSKWSQIETNLNKLLVAKSNIRIIITPTVQVYNMTHLPELILWKLKHFEKVKFTLHPLHNPPHLSVKIFSKEAKLAIEDYFKNVLHKLEGIISDEHFAYLKSELDAYVSFMNSEDLSQHLETFKHLSSALDESRNQSLRDVNPLTYELIYE
jgi:sulfatase maturation enzyme AslB (radical SAM superfamily)